MARLDDLRRFYVLLRQLEELLGGTRRLSDCTGRMSWPTRGVYFFMEPGEGRSETGHGLRIVRVGTHALTARSKTKLWDRLRQHRGPASSGLGNHRGSIFRLIVGTALIERDGICCPSWDDGHGHAPSEIRQRERPVEGAVSQVIGRMPLLWLGIEDEPGRSSLRGYLERNAIALLSNYGRHAIDPPTSNLAWTAL